jgi:hypothetical protein
MKAAFAAHVFLYAPSAQALTIHNDNGGYVLEYVIRFHRAAKPIRIMGACKSACTLALTHASTCVGPRASLWFHAPSVFGRPNNRVKRWLMAQYPARIRTWINSHGGLSSRLITLSGPALRARVRSC